MNVVRERLTALVLTLCLVPLLSCTLWAPAKRATWDNATGGEQFERLLWGDIQARNVAELEKRLALTVTWMTAEGPLDRAAAIDFLTTRMHVTSVSPGEFKITPNGDTMTVAYHLHRAATLDGRPLPSPVHAVSVWQRTEGGWHLIAHAEQPAGR